MIVKTNKKECNYGDVWYNGNYYGCPVDYCRIEELKDYVSQRKSRDGKYFSALKELNKLTTLALRWETLS